ncbi:MAG TPA: hypothetical protein VN631_15405 [Negativicutes bacterium]|nr:hypothetical protein [Negativicutes bacterium]
MKFFRSMLTFLLAGLFLIAIPATSLAAEAWTTDPATGCKIGVVFLTDNWTLVSASWTGPVVEGKAAGKGVLTYVYKDDGKEIKVQGEAMMVDGLLEGKAALKWPPEGNSYDGDYKAGLRDGKGVLKWPTGQVYDGEWKNGMSNGYGVLKDASGKVLYEGEWKDGKGVANSLMVDKILGIPWGASEDEAKRIMLQRSKTMFIKSEKGTARNWQFYYGPYNEFDAYIYVNFYQGKMYEVSPNILVGEDQVMEKFNAVKQGLSKRYGSPIKETGKYLDSLVIWDLGGVYRASITIRKSTVSTQPPFIVTIEYYNNETAVIVNNALETTTGKDY